MAMNFYSENATAFVHDFGLMPGLIDKLGLPETVRRIFTAKLSKIHEAVSRIAREEIEKQGR